MTSLGISDCTTHVKFDAIENFSGNKLYFFLEQRINSEVEIKVLLKPMNNPLGVSPSKGKQGTTRGKEKIL